MCVRVCGGGREIERERFIANKSGYIFEKNILIKLTFVFISSLVKRNYFSISRLAIFIK